MKWEFCIDGSGRPIGPIFKGQKTKNPIVGKELPLLAVKHLKRAQFASALWWKLEIMHSVSLSGNSPPCVELRHTSPCSDALPLDTFLTLCLFKIHFNIILLSISRSHMWSLPSMCSDEYFVYICHIFICAKCHTHFLLFDMIALILFGDAPHCEYFSNFLLVCPS